MYCFPVDLNVQEMMQNKKTLTAIMEYPLTSGNDQRGDIFSGKLGYSMYMQATHLFESHNKLRIESGKV
jgi:hypothetical protein